MTALDQHHLARLDSTVAVPTYQRAAVTPGIVHLGVGNFHRAHQAMYLDTLMNAGKAMDWGIYGVGLQPSNWTMRDALAAQDNLYTLVLRHNDGTWDARVIGSLVEYSFAPDDPQAVIGKLADPRIRIVTITVTEGGYSIDPLTGRFDPADELVAADLRGDGAPRTMFGLVIEALVAPASALASLLSRLSRATTSKATGTSPSRPSPASPSLRDPRPGVVDHRQRPVPELDGRPDHAADH